MKKICKKRIFIIFSIILISFVTLNFCYTDVSAQINPDTDKIAVDLAEALNNVLKNFDNFALNSIFSGLASLLTMLAAFLYFILATIFSGGAGSLFPSPDNVIFNRVAILDINFFNPNANSLIGMAKSGDNFIIPQIYNSFHVIAVSLFIIAAMLVGIKMAISTIAADKAAAKKAMVNWLVGILVLFLMRLILAGIFEINEYIVYKVAEASGDETTMFTIDTSLSVKDAFNLLGSPLSLAIKTIGAIGTAIATGSNTIELPGYGGMLLMFAYNAACGDLLAAILLFVLLGQSITLFVAYAKRLMYSIILGLCAPIVVAIDTISKSTKGQSTVLSNWFKEFVGTVFIQSFHAILILVTLNIIHALVNNTEASSTFIGLASIVLISGIVKFEKLYKQIFGISDGMMGGLKGQASKMIAGVHGATQGVKAIADNGQKLRKAGIARKTAQSEKELAMKSFGEANFEKSKINAQMAISAEKDPIKRAEFAQRALKDLETAEKSGFGNQEDEKEKMEQYRNFLNNVISGNYVPGQESQTGGARPIGSIGHGSLGGDPIVASAKARFEEVIAEGFAAGDAEYDSAKAAYGSALISNIGNASVSANTSNHNTTNNSGSQSASVSTKQLEQELNKLTREISNLAKKNDSVEASKRKIDDANRKIQQANSEFMSAAVATASGPINLAAGIGFGLGSGDDLSEAALKGGYVTKGLDTLAEKIGSEIGKNMKAFDKNASVDNTN